MIRQTAQELKALSKLISYFKKHGVSKTQASNVFEADGIEALDKIIDNPFAPIMYVSRYTIKEADKLAKHIPMDDPRRLAAYMNVSLKDVLGDEYEYKNNSGDTWVKLSQLKKAFKRRFSQVADFDHCLELSGAVVDGTKVTSKLLHESEQTIAEWLVDCAERMEYMEYKSIYFAALEKMEGSHYSDEQKQSIANSVCFFASVLTGSAGTGKTECIKGMVSLNHHTMLLAPTGKAAKRMSFMTSNPAYTIHLAILSPQLSKELAKADIVIIDEVSMLDVIIFARFLNFMAEYNPDARIVLCGDEHQLESVQAGALLRDVIKADVCPVVRLTKNYRQGAGSVIAENAKKIWDGDTDIDVVDGQFEVLEVEDYWGLFDELKQNKPDGVIISAQNHTVGWGVNPLNFLMQYWHNPLDRKGETIFNHYRNKKETVIMLADIPKREIYAGEIGYITEVDKRTKKTILKMIDDEKQLTLQDGDFEKKVYYKKVFRPGDVIMFTRNDRERGLVNGDMGTVLTVSKDTVTVDFFDGNTRKTKTISRDKKSKKIEDMTLATVITGHKMQGDEAESVTVLISKSFYKTHRNWLATSVMRGKKYVRIIHDGCLNSVIKRKAKSRKTQLVDFIDRIK